MSTNATLLSRVTIVIPVYADLPTIALCLESVIAHADHDWVDVLVVNDSGPEADAIETRILGMIAGQTRFRYERNDQNLGFVQTCNRAVFELDQTDNDILLLNSDAMLTPGALSEMRDVLALSERHGVVCPRSNDATIATLPFYRRDKAAPSFERTTQIFAAIRDRVPRYYVTPAAVGFCFLVKRSLIVNHGLFDEVYGAGYNEENDFCLRINDIGYSALMANHALVFHASSSSFGAERRAELDAVNGARLLTRYPFFRDVVVRFIRQGYSTVDRFAEVLVPEADQPRRVLIDLHHLSKVYDGTTKNVLSVLEYLAESPPPASIEVTIAAYADTREFFHLDSYGLRVLDYEQIEEVFDLGISPVPVTSFGQLAALNRYCARFAVSHLDAIALRTLRLAAQTPIKATVVTEALHWADRVLTISEGSLDDVAALFPEQLGDLRSRSRVITQGSGIAVGGAVEKLSGTSALSPLARRTITSGGYALIVGNGFRHKQVRQALRALIEAGIPVVAMGDLDIAGAHPDLPIVLSGTLSEAELGELYDGASVVVYPSAYEGFGLPIAEATHHGKKLVLFDTEVSREVVATLGIQGARFFGTFDSLGAEVRHSLADTTPVNELRVRTLHDYAADFWAAGIDLLDTPIDLEALIERDSEIARLAGIAEGTLDIATRLLHQNTEIMTSRTFRLARSFSKVSGLVRRALPRQMGTAAPAVDRSIIDQS